MEDEWNVNEIWTTRGSHQRNIFLQASHEKEQRAKETIHNLKAAGQVVNFKVTPWRYGLPSGYVKIAIENGDLVRGFSH